MTAQRSRIFISYRREDAEYPVGRLAEDLRNHFARDQVFQDIASIDPGADFVEALNSALDTCAAVLVVIGPKWLVVADRQGRRRLELSDDWVRHEIAESLRQPDVRVFPLLLDAEMPSAEELPEPLRPLTRRQALPLTGRHWSKDVAELVECLKKVPGLATAPVPGAEAPKAKPTLESAECATTPLKPDYTPGSTATSPLRTLPGDILRGARPQIQQCINKVKLIATSKRIHDHLHELRQNVIRPIVESALVQWRADGQLGVPVATLIALKIGFAEARIRDIANERRNLDEVTGKVVLGALAGVEEANPSAAFQNPTPDLNEFGRKIGRFAAAVQTAFSLTDAVMRKDSNKLNELHTSLLADLKRAIEGRKFGAAEDAKLNDVLQRAESNRKRLIGVLDAHHDWQSQHDKLDMLNGFRRNEDFRDQLENYLANDSLTSMLESEKAMVEQADASPILGERLAVLSENLARLSPTEDLPGFDSMRKIFDDVFYQIDKRTLAAVEASEQRVRDLESRLEEMAGQQSEAA